MSPRGPAAAAADGTLIQQRHQQQQQQQPYDSLKGSPLEQQQQQGGFQGPPVVSALSSSDGGASSSQFSTASTYNSALPAVGLPPAHNSSSLGAAGSSSRTPQGDQQGKAAADGPGHASLRAQAGALYRKNAVYQRRNLCSNICLLSAPIFFCVMLLAVQVAINRLLLTGDDYEVGKEREK